MNLKSGQNINGYLLETSLSNTNNPVWLAYETSAERDVVLKFVRNRKAAVRERILMVDIDHPNIAKLLSTFTHQESTVLVLEYKSGHNLLRLWENLDRKTGLNILLDVASALHAVHARGLWHGDVSHLNVIYSEEKKKAFLVDFSFEGKCAPGFHAPEDFDNNPNEVNCKTDIFRFGILIDLLRPDLKPKFLDCLCPDPQDRPTIEMVLRRLQKQKSPRNTRFLLLAATLFMGFYTTGFYWRSQPVKNPPPQQITAQRSESKAGRKPKPPTHTRLLASYPSSNTSRSPRSVVPARIQNILSDEP